MAPRGRRVTSAELEGVPDEGAPVPSPDDEEREWVDFGERMERIAQETAPGPEPEDDVPVVKAFDDRWRDGFEGLLYLGRLEHEFEFAGHRFLVKTLTTGEKLEVGQICKPMEGSITYLAAFRAAKAAAGIVSVDGKPIPVAMKGSSPIRQRYEWMAANWHDVVLDAIYENVEWLEAQVLAILDALGVFDEPFRAVEVEGPPPS